MRIRITPRSLLLAAVIAGLFFAAIWVGTEAARKNAPPAGEFAPKVSARKQSLPPTDLHKAPAASIPIPKEDKPPAAALPDPQPPIPLAATFKAAPIRSEEAAGFKPFVWPNGKPHYEGEPVTAFVRVGSSGEQVALSVSQGGEYPRVQIQPKEEVQVRLKFSTLAPQTPVAFTAQDGGAFKDGRPGAMFRVDDARELGFAFTASANEGTHRVTFSTPGGETKVLDFWVGPFNQTRKLTRR